MSERAQVVRTGGAISSHEARLEQRQHPIVASEEGHGGQLGFHVMQEVVLVLVHGHVTQRFAECNVADGVDAEVAGQITPVHWLGTTLRGRNVF